MRALFFLTVRMIIRQMQIRYLIKIVRFTLSLKYKNLLFIETSSLKLSISQTHPYKKKEIEIKKETFLDLKNDFETQTKKEATSSKK